MTITAKYPAALPTMTDYTDTGVGREKANATNPNDLARNIVGPEYSQLCGEAIAIAQKLGTDLSKPPDYGDDCLGSHTEILEFKTVRSDRAVAIDHFVFNAYGTAFFSELNTGGTGTAVSGGVGVGQIICGAGLQEGWSQGRYIWNQRTSKFRCRWRINGLPAGGADTIKLGWEDAAGHFAKIHVTDPTAPSRWTAEVDNGASFTDTFTSAVDVAVDTWYDFEIWSDSSGVVFWINRGTAGQEKITIAQAPFDGVCRPIYEMTSAAGGEFMFNDLMEIRDTRPL